MDPTAQATSYKAILCRLSHSKNCRDAIECLSPISHQKTALTHEERAIFLATANNQLQSIVDQQITLFSEQLPKGSKKFGHLLDDWKHLKPHFAEILFEAEKKLKSIFLRHCY
jgi:tRNA splicing ligase